MPSEADAIEALRKRLLARIKEGERQLAEWQEMVRVLGEAPKVAGGGGITRPAPRSDDTEKKPGARYNLDLSKHVDDYIAGYPFEQAVNIKDMIKTLRADYGVQGKDSSLYAYIHSLLKKKTEDSASRLKYEKGVGYYKSRGEDKESTLVASV